MAASSPSRATGWRAWRPRLERTSISMKLPKVAQKVERFYKNIVEESLFG